MSPSGLLDCWSLTLNVSKDTFAHLHPRNFIPFFPGEVANVSNLLSAQDSREGRAQVPTFHPPEDPPDSVSKIGSSLGEDGCLNRVDSEIRNSVLPFPGDNQLPVVSSSGKLTVSNTLSLAISQSKLDHGYAATIDLVDGKGPLGFEHFSDSPTFTCIVNDEVLLDAPPDLCSGEMEDSIVLEPVPKSLPEALLERVFAHARRLQTRENLFNNQVLVAILLFFEGPEFVSQIAC